MRKASTPGTTSLTSDRPGEENLVVERVLQSTAFQKSPALRTLLEYLWRQRGSSFSEYAIAVEALGRRSDFDAKLDSTVRVHVSRLRQKLKEYYDGEGKDDATLIQIPLGSHHLHVQMRELADPQPAADDTVRKGWRMVVAILGSLCAVLICLCLYLFLKTLPHEVEAGRARSTNPAPTFWSHFVSDGRPVAIYLSSPAFFEWEGNAIKVRDTNLNGFEWEKSPELVRLSKSWGPPRLLSNYAVIFDALAASRISQFLQSRDLPVSIATTFDMDIHTLGQHNTILLGTPRISGSRLNGVLDEMNFYFDDLGHNVINRKPKPSEPSTFLERRISQTHSIELGIIALLSGGSDSGNLLLLTSQHTATLASPLLSSATSGSFEDAWRKGGSPSHFEAVVEVETDGKNALRTRIAAIRAIRFTGWQRYVGSR